MLVCTVCFESEEVGRDGQREREKERERERERERINMYVYDVCAYRRVQR